jgi:hypothetical protein
VTTSDLFYGNFETLAPNRIAIQSISTYYHHGPVYNLEVTPNHDWKDDQFYINSSTGIVVHNCHPRDNIALRSFAIKHNFNYDLFDAIVVAREEQANNMAKFFEKINVPKTMPVVILGSGFKPGVNQKEGSPSILVGYYLEKLGYSVSYDTEQFEENRIYKEIACPSLISPAAYLIGWPNHFNEYRFARGSIVVDPWRSLDTKRPEVTIYHYGNTRTSDIALFKVTEDEYKY